MIELLKFSWTDVPFGDSENFTPWKVLKTVHSAVQYYIDNIELDPWHFYHKRPHGKCFYKKNEQMLEEAA